ncbi:hypothetical protein G4B88_006235 [Cannabis sativa]|uniref:Uncharacterized protein n=1 Tax=Cannabis sativa TaxID=3483 RepID=A0A7J6ICS2_CANSA|nr:hypothetical protein G4B88_006235 [Cannabis sativa]
MVLDLASMKMAPSSVHSTMLELLMLRFSLFVSCDSLQPHLSSVVCDISSDDDEEIYQMQRSKAFSSILVCLPLLL